MAKKVEDLDLQEAEAEKSLEEIEQALLEVRAKKQAALPRCGHVNSHSLDTKNEPDNLECKLPKGHVGNHKAPHLEWEIRPTPQHYDAKRNITTPAFPGETKEVVTEWGDAAGADFVVPPSAKSTWVDGAVPVTLDDGSIVEMPWGEK